jgi:hypothetical protein
MIALWKPQPAQPLRSQLAESWLRGLAERMLSPARRVPLPAHLSSSSCGPILLSLAVLQASPRGGQPSATPQLRCSLTSQRTCAAAFPARSSSCCHPPPDPCRTLGQLLCARCGGDPPDLRHLWAPSLSCLAPDRVAVAVPMCSWAVATALGHSHTVGVDESGHELGNGSYDSLPEQRAMRCPESETPRDAECCRARGRAATRQPRPGRGGAASAVTVSPTPAPRVAQPHSRKTEIQT